MATTRFKGESGSDRLGVSTISDSDMIQVRHKPGTVDDADKGVSKAVLNSCPFGVSSTAAATAAKTAALTDSNPDFTLISGREVVVCFSAANSASSPTLNFAGSGAYPMYYPDGTAIGNWDAGTWMHLKYFEATINETLIQRWIALSPVVTNAITSGDKRPAASGAVNTALSTKYTYLPRAGTSFTDCNTVADGLFCSSGVAHAPADSSGFIFVFTMSFDNNSSFRYQMAFLVSNTNIHTRVSINGSWTSWVVK